MRILFVALLSLILFCSCLSEERVIEMGGNLGRLKATSVDLGVSHSCAIREDESLKCWGENTTGQLGLGDDFSRGIGSWEMLAQFTTVSLLNDDGDEKYQGVRQVSLGGFHSCAIFIPTGDTDDEIKCWGNNDRGQLGRNNTSFDDAGEDSVSDVANLDAIDFGTNAGEAKMVYAGYEHVCALLEGLSDTTATDDQIVCWGHGNGGKLGRLSGANAGDTAGTPLISASMFVQLRDTTAGPNTDRRHPVYVAAGNSHTCAILAPDTRGGAPQEDGSYDVLRCWGDNSLGQLGLDSTATPKLGDSAANDLSEDTRNALLGQRTSFGIVGSVKAIALGDDHTCAILDRTDDSSATDDVMQCFGRNNEGQLGIGANTGANARIDTTAEFQALADVNLGVDRYPKKIFAAYNTTCAIVGHYVADGDASPDEFKCWGYNGDGVLGRGNTTNTNAPGAAIALGANRRLVGASVGDDHVCAMLTSNSTGMLNAVATEVFCFGKNENGQLGYGTFGQNIGDDPDEMGDSTADIRLQAVID